MKCAIELTDPPNAEKYYTYLMRKKDSDLAALPAIRLAKYFYIQDQTLGRDDVETIGRNIIVLNPKAKKLGPLERLHFVQKECENWLKQYGKYEKTYEGQGVLYELGHAYLSEANMDKDDKKKPPVKDDKQAQGIARQGGGAALSKRRRSTATWRKTPVGSAARSSSRTSI